ncbi:MAG: hydrogenase maturation protease [Anaerolineales bacterium]|nr:hydrogenase maturation protease [Anaerolineales bacterium]MCX7756295.1 hydrogenase maturation protease [Anaerolineales bacterium]MDW8276623.1 hydrogenase maturation protease [Anaerolineales bacterium]
MKTLIIGLGNPILGDDGVGWKVAQQVERQLPSPPTPLPQGEITVECLSLAGISLMEHMIGYERVILIDSLNTGRYPQGEVVTFRLDALEDLTYGHSASAHDLSLKRALELGRRMGASLPQDEEIQVVAIEAAHVYDFTEELTPPVAAAVPRAVAAVFEALGAP